MENDARKLVEILQKDERARVHFRYFAEEDHATIFHLALYKGFQELYSRKTQD